MSKLKTEDVYDPDLMIEGMAIILSWTIFLPLRFVAWLGKRGREL